MRLVVKLAGALLDDPAAVENIAQQVAQLARNGHELLVVHGGGKIFTATLARMGIESSFINGLRVTDRETRDVGVMVFAGLLNKRLSAAISRQGVPAIGLSAADAECFQAEPMQVGEVTGRLGFVGYLSGANVTFLESLWRAGVVPVAACLGMGADGELYNINADHMAAACAEFVRADRLIFLTDVAGVLDGEKVLQALSCEEVEALIRQNKVSGGMVLKLEACKRALSGGVRQVRIVGGGVPDGLLRAANGTKFPGTKVTRLFPGKRTGAPRRRTAAIEAAPQVVSR
ncbi:MAG: acetylglutamate kinase [Acidobacteria bacterium]|nr:acetylglutamate kinase [Acidobacteriota bacterium]MBI3664303.1 acetylglutamate kinase [Acidobacteriota bacterium]